ncbi:hypothetical protein SRHO_G00306170 [Serrasalmus rhombeus]
MPRAADAVNALDQRALASILAAYGEERHAGKIAAAIARARSVQPIARTQQLASIVAGRRAWVRFPGRATRVLSMWVSSGFSGFLPQTCTQANWTCYIAPGCECVSHCLCLSVCPAMDWRPLQGVSYLPTR